MEATFDEHPPDNFSSSDEDNNALQVDENEFLDPEMEDALAANENQGYVNKEKATSQTEQNSHSN